MVKTETLCGSKLLGTILMLMLFVASPGATHAQVVCDDDPEVPGEMLIVLEFGQSLDAINDIVEQYNLVLLDSIEIHRLYNVRIPPGETTESMEDHLEDDHRIDRARAHRLADTPEGVQLSIPDLGVNISNDDVIQQDTADTINVAEAQQKDVGDGVVIAVLDTGIDLDHPDYAHRILGPGVDFADGNGTAAAHPDFLDNDLDGLIDESLHHGTFVVGLIHMVAPDAWILPIRTLDADGQGASFRLAQAIHYAIDHGAHVINLSLGMLHDARAVEMALQRASLAGIVVVAAAGNRGEPNVDVEDEEIEGCRSFPAQLPSTIAVAAVDEFLVKTDFSDYGPLVDLSAPAVDMLSTFGGGAYAEWAGTSFAAPLVSGAVALILDKYPGLSPDDVRDMLIQTVQPDNNPPELDGLMGAGVLDLDALTQALAVNRSSLELEKFWGLTSVSWSHVAGVTEYDLARGDLADLRLIGGDQTDLGSLTCVSEDDAHNSTYATDLPAPGQGYFYVMRDNGTDPEGFSYGDQRIVTGQDCGNAP